jgi:tetratricopeptide (TPR) repeat protein
MRFLSLAAIIAGLALLDLALAKTERAELAAAADRYRKAGLNLLQEGKAEEAVDSLRQAYVIDRTNRGYQLPLMAALTAAHKTEEADRLMEDVLLSASNDGEANLAAARLKAAEGKAGEAEAYYHRAIYGIWANGSGRGARLELVEYLARNGRKQALLAELIPLEEETGPTTRIAQLFLKAGSPSRAAQTYTALQDFAGLGQAQLEAGDYVAALHSFLKAFSRSPNDTGLRARMELASSMAALDPMPRRLSSREKYHRSLRILALAQTRWNRCTQSDQTAGPTPPPPQMTNELAEANLTAAEKIWKESLARCGPGSAAAEEPLRLIMQKLAQ